MADRIGSAQRVTVAAVAAVAATYTLAAVLAPAVAAVAPGIGALLNAAYAPVCHQIPDRCINLGAGAMAVCARCAGLYVGGVLGTLLPAVTGWSPRPRPLWLLVLLLPSVLDFGAGLVGGPSLPNLPRFLLAAPLGGLLGLYLAAAVAEVVDQLRTQREPDDPVQ